VYDEPAMFDTYYVASKYIRTAFRRTSLKKDGYKRQLTVNGSGWRKSIEIGKALAQNCGKWTKF
jgi:hypothetical protein